MSLCLLGYSWANDGESFQPVLLPDPGITGFRFPEEEATILRWVKSHNQGALAAHGWGLWTALTQWSGQVFEGQQLRVFETWKDPTDFAPPQATGPAHAFSARAIRRIPRRFVIPQLETDLIVAEGVNDQKPISDNAPSVKYDPEASDWIAKNGLLSKKTLKTMLDQHRDAIPPFRRSALVLKPMFEALASNPSNQDRYFLLHTWRGPLPLTSSDKDQMWHAPTKQAERFWNQCVWIDLRDPDKNGTGASACMEGRTDGATYGVNQFIHFRLSKVEAGLVNDENKRQQINATAKTGDYAVLVALHVTTKEIGRWTWQTFWWSDQPDHPPAPSSDEIAARRPIRSEASVRHYAQCAAYQDVLTTASSGKTVEESVYCYNPYLEAGALPFAHIPGLTRKDGKLVKTPNDAGVQTNCMSCHGNANFPASAKAPQQTGARSLEKSAAFKGFLRLDFLWSLNNNSQ